MKVAVVGGGWSGLAVATFLQQRGHDATVLEARDRVGGRIATTAEDHYVVEHGPHAVMLRNEATRHLMEASGLEFLPAPKLPRLIVHKHRVRPLPASPPALLASPLLSPAAKARVLLEPWVRRARSDQSVRELVVRRFGRAAAPWADAMVGGVHAGDPDRLSARHAFAALWRMDQEGGVLRALAKRRGGSALQAPRAGMGAWPEALARRLDVRTGTAATAVHAARAGVEVETADGVLEADKAVIALEPAGAARLLGGRPPALAPVTVVAFATRQEAAPPAAYGFLAPEAEGRFVLGCLYESSLWPRAPPGKALLRCFVGGARHGERAMLPDDRIAAAAWQDLQDLGVVEGEPARTWVVRTAGIPQMELGHGRWLERLPDGPVHVMGIGHRAVGLDALAQEAWELSARISP